MPEMDGDVAVQQICQSSPTPFILVSAYSKPVAGDVGAIGGTYLTKPVKRADLEGAIAKVCPDVSDKSTGA
jgi:CheY-like chemotaxis protein